MLIYLKFFLNLKSGIVMHTGNLRTLEAEEKGTQKWDAP